MTIAAGFQCSDGLLLCSDTLLSGTTQNRQGEKLWVLQDKDPVVVFGGASENAGALLRARDEIRRKLKPKLSLINTVDRIDTALKKVHDKFPNFIGRPAVQALVAIRSGTQLSLYVNEPGDVSLSPVARPWRCVGAADSLADYFAESLFAEGMSVYWAKVIATHMVWNCKIYASGYCGGETHLVSIPKKGRPVVVRQQAEIHQLEQYLAGLERAYNAVLPKGSPRESASWFTLVARAKDIIEAIEKAERTIYFPGQRLKPDAQQQPSIPDPDSTSDS